MTPPKAMRPSCARCVRAKSHAPIVRALRAGDAMAATRYMEQAVGDVGEQIADAMGSTLVAVPRRRQAG